MNNFGIRVSAASLRSTSARWVLAGALALSLSAACPSAYAAAPPATGLSSAAGQDMPIGASQNTYIDINPVNGRTFFGSPPTSVAGTAWIDPSTGDASFSTLFAPTITNVNTLNFTGAMGNLDMGSANTVLELQGTPPCAANQALTKVAGGFSCVSVTDLTGLGTVMLPTCPATQALSSDGVGGFFCVSMPTGPAGAAGAAGASGPPGPVGATGTMPPGPVPGALPLYGVGFQVVGSANYNNLILLGSGGGGLGECGVNGENDPTTAAKAKDINCAVFLCNGQYGIPAFLPSSVGVCEAFDGNPLCAGGFMGVGVDCLYN